MREDILKAAAWVFIITIILIVGISAVTPVSQFFNNNVLGSAKALTIGPMATIPGGGHLPSIGPTRFPGPSLIPRISLPAFSPTPAPSQGGTFTYLNPPTTTPTVEPSINAIETPTITAEPSVDMAAVSPTVQVPTVTPQPAHNPSIIEQIVNFIKGLFGMK